MSTPSIPNAPVPCSSCGTAFSPRLRYQVETVAGAQRYFCSLPCKAAPSGDVNCSECRTAFTPIFAYQTLRAQSGAVAHACSEVCAKALSAKRAPPKKVAWRIAVLNQKGGTGKTTTSVSLAAGLATEGRRVLLVDADPQGNVGTCLGIRASKTLADVLTKNIPIADIIVPVGETLDVVCADERLAQAEIELARHPKRAGVLARALSATNANLPEYDHVIIDCGPSLSLINQNALCAVHDVLCPVACDYLSLVGVKQVLRTLDNVRKHLGHPIAVAGVLPTMYDARARVCRDALKTLQTHFGESCLEPIRQNTKLKEAPAHKKTIFEHDPSSNGAKDYQKLVDWALAHPLPSSKREAPAPRTAPARTAAQTAHEVGAPVMVTQKSSTTV